MNSGTKASIAIVVGTLGTFVGIFALAVHQRPDCSYNPQAKSRDCESSHGGHGGGSGSGGGDSEATSRGGFGAAGEGHAGSGGHGGGGE